jgi:hypothetical protein
MTLRELVSTCHNIGQLNLDIRDERGILIDCVHIGTRCQPDKYANEEHNTAPRWKVINKPVNTKETGSDYWGTIISNIPKSLLDKEVTLWQLWHGFSLNNNCWQFYELQANLLGVDKYIETTAKEECEQLEGQMSIEDFIGGSHD